MGTARFTKKMVSLTLAGSLSLSLLGAANGAAGTEGSVTDIGGHWAERDIKQWISQGLIGGYEDGSFQPDKAVTRAEFVALVNRVFGFKTAGSAAFKDLKAADWSYADFQKAVTAGYITGFEDGSVHANSPITRQEIAVIVGRLLGLAPSAQDAEGFSDAASIPSWSKGAVGAVEAGGIMNGYEDHAFRPASKATRAEAIVILSQALKVKSAPVVFDKAATYGPETGTRTIKGDVVISAPGITLRNTVIEGNLTFAPGIGEGDAVLMHVAVKGTTLVQGGGVHSIHFEDSVLLTVVVDKAAGLVRIVAEGSTTVASAVMQTGATLEESGLTGDGFTDVQLSRLLPQGTTVTLLGSFNDVDVTGVKVRIDIPSGSVEHITVTGDATGNDIKLGNDATIVDLVLNAAVKVTGGGTIDTVQMNKEAQVSSTFENQPDRMEDETGTVINPKPPTSSGPSQQQLDQWAADKVTVLIAALPATVELTLTANETDVAAANSAFDALTAVQKALVTTDNQTKLSGSVARIAELKADKAAADEVIALIEALPAPAAIRLEDETAVTDAKNAFGALSAVQKTLVTNEDKLTQAIARIASRKAAADDVALKIAALPDAAAVTLDDQAAVASAQAAFNALTAAQKMLVTNQDKLTQAVAKIDALIAAANAVTAQIAALPAPADLALSDESAVTAANNAYNALTAAQQVLVTNQTKLIDAAARIVDLKAANAVNVQIAALPDTTNLTLSDEAAVTAANTAFTALTTVQQKLVTNQTKLEDALSRIAVLKAQYEADQQAAAAMTEQINDLPALADLTLLDEPAVTAATNAYNQLSATQQTLVTNHDKLLQLEARIAQFHMPQYLTSLEIANLDFSTVYGTQARVNSIPIADTNFKSHPVPFTISDGTTTIPVLLNWDIPLYNNSTGMTVGSAVESFIQQYCIDHQNADFSRMTLAAGGTGNTFYISTFSAGTQATVTLGGDYSTFFTTDHFSGSDDDTSKNRAFTVSDSIRAASIVLKGKFSTIDALILSLNNQLTAASVGAVFQKVDATHFKISPTVAYGTLTISGTDKAQFFNAFQLN